MNMLKKTPVITIIIVAVAAIAMYFFKQHDAPPAPDSWATGIINGTSTVNDLPSVLTNENSKVYKSEALDFSFRYPNDLNVSSVVNEGVTVVIVQNPEKAQGIQIMVSEFDEAGSVLTVERIKQDIPDLKITDPQTLLLGASTGQGVAFLSDNQDFAGNSREVWFVYKNHLYQISTYARLDTLLQSILVTWEFK
jgi:hypothetical protein